MPDVKRTVRLVTKQKINPDVPPLQEGFPMRNWNIEIYILNETDKTPLPANMYSVVTYKLHPSFEARANQQFKDPPFRIAEEGWGEFDLSIVLTVMGKGGEHTIAHDLNFQSERYEADHKVTFKNPKPDLMALLRESGPVPGDENGAKASKTDSTKKKKNNKTVDMEKLAEGLQKLGEDDLLQVVQMVHDNKNETTYTKNDVENGEFHVDLYTLPDFLVKMLWDFTASKTDI